MIQIKKILSILLIALLLGVQTAPVALAEDVITPPVEAQSTPPAEQQNTAVSPTSAPSQAPDTGNAASNVNGETDYDMDASDPDNAARKYRLWVKEQEKIKEEQEKAAKAAQATITSGANNTSGQSANGQNGDAEVKTGDATNTAIATTYGNNNLAENPSAQIGSGAGASVINDGNGTDSNNNGSASINNDTTTNQNNSATVNNSLTQSTSTGDNTANGNTGGNSSIDTGDANTSGTVITSVNTNASGVMVSEFNINDDHMGDYVLDFGANCVIGCGGGSSLAQNSNNGSDSDNTAGVDVTNSNNTFQNNDATIGNDLVLSADSGHNTASENTRGDSTIKTGDANVSANVVTLANNNIAGNVVLGVVNIFGDLIGDIIFPEDQFKNCCGNTNALAANTNNGSGSTNDANTSIDNSDAYFQTNDVDIVNNLNFDATTGENTASGNTNGNSEINTGNTTIDANVLNIANTNIIGGNWWLVLVNEGGNWIGKIMGADGQNFAGAQGTDFQVDENGFITAAINDGNGSDSTNNANNTQTNSNTTTQTNKATITNNLDLSANTGYNETSDNTKGNNKIKTGDANIVANLVNFVNNNIAGNGKLFVTVINVFGSWQGNFFGPDQKKEAAGQPTPGGVTASNTSGSGNSGTNSSNNSVQDTNATANTSGGTTLLVKGNGGSEYEDQVEVLGAKSSTLVKNATFDKDSLFGDKHKNGFTLNLAWLILLAPIFFTLLITKRMIKRMHLPRR